MAYNGKHKKTEAWFTKKFNIEEHPIKIKFTTATREKN